MESNRRGFLTGGAALVSSRFASAAPGGKKVRVGIAGGGFGTGFQFHQDPDCVVEAVTDLRPERRDKLMQVYGCSKSYESLEKMLFDKKVDAVFCATPAPDHLRHVKMTLDAGKHVMSAVPAVVGSLEDCGKLVEVVKQSGLNYMMAETSYYHQGVISARQFYQEGKFGRIFSAEAEYHHPGLEELFFEKDGKRTWRYGFAPMHYPTHSTAMLLGVTRERLTSVSCIGWGDNDPILKDNVYKNPFWNETALFNSNKGTAFRVHVYWRGAVRGTERGQWLGTKMSMFEPNPNGLPTILIHEQSSTEKDSGGFVRRQTQLDKYEQPLWWKTDMLPEAMRHNSGHEGSHTFLTHEFVRSIVEHRRPAVDVYEAVAYTAPGIVAHESALKGGVSMKIPQFDPA
ncbi:MAG: Gfo/Idh/MocA family oxidoreductase [Acidobacteria bacterium]|nr:Gfo/Idh/MocA family oxidoreductase [Acidobacteriota bacterium]